MKKRTAQKKKNSKKIFLNIIYIVIPLIVVGFLSYNLIEILSIKISNKVSRSEILSNNSELYPNVFILEDTQGRIRSIDVLVINSDEQKVLNIHIPGWVYIPTNDLDWVSMIPISSLPSVGNFSKYGSGAEFTLWYLEKVLGFKTNNYFWYKGDIEEYREFVSSASFFELFFSNNSRAELEGSTYSNLPVLNMLSELNSVSLALNNYGYDSINVGDDFVEDVMINENVFQYHFAQRDFDKEIKKFIPSLVSKRVVRERVNVEVYNGSDITGVAYSYARRIANSGCRVLRYDNSPSSYEKTVIYVPNPEEYKYSLEIVRDIVGYDYEIKNDRPSFITTGDIVVVFGRDILDSFNF